MQTYSFREYADKSRIFVVDSDKASNEALTQILSAESDTVVMSDVVAALDWDSHWPPELILLGTSIIAIEGAGAVARFKKRFPGVKILIVCDRLDDDKVRQAHLFGAESALLRPLSGDAVRSQVNGMLGSLRRQATH